MSDTATKSSGAKQARAHLQKFGTFLSGMIMPNIGALIAWGLITALFIEVGWTPVARIGGFGEYDGMGIVGPMITYMLPLLIGYTGGKMAYPDHDTRGGVIGAVATMGVIVGVPGSPMFLGAMIMGPLGGYTMKKLDALWHGKIKPGFEMLVNNFSAGIWGMIIAVIGIYLISPVVNWIMDVLGNIVEMLVNNNLLPLTSILIEPAKVLFLNNAINHGVLTPLGTDQVASAGKSVLFLLEANPGPGLGILVAYMLFGAGAAKASAPGAIVIHFFGGIHEIYFPYVLMKPSLLLAVIGGGMTGVFTNVIFDNGLVGPAAPGSIIAVEAMASKGDQLTVFIAVTAAAIVSFFIAAPILRLTKDPEGDLHEATAQMEGMKGKKSSVSQSQGSADISAPSDTIKNIVFACDAGMGSSAMGASVLRTKIKDAGYGDVVVTNESIANLKDKYQVVVTHQDLADRARPKVPSATVVTVDNFMGSPRYDEVVGMIRDQRDGGAASGGNDVAADQAEVEFDGDPDILHVESVVLGGKATNQAEAITEAGKLLVARGAVDEGYVDAMHDREATVSTYMGNLLAIPHGTNEAKGFIHSSAMSFVRFDEELDWKGKPVKFVIGIAGKGNEHLGILGKIAKIFSNSDEVKVLENARSADEVLEILGKVNA